MFKILRKLCGESNIPVESLSKTDSPLSKEEDQILIKLAQEIDWKRNRRCDLLRRIRRIANKTTFSFRETLLLRRLILKQKSQGFFDFDLILDHFPGKTTEMVKDHYIKKFGNNKAGLIYYWPDKYENL